jgi:hypothetical protein
MGRPSQPEMTSRRTGLQATVPCYLTDVSVDEHGFITDFAVAYLPEDVDPGEIKRALGDALNLDEPHRCELYDAEDRYLAGHPGTPGQQPPPGRLAPAIRRANRQLMARRRGAKR